ncbi:glycosyltransferase [Microbacterium sp. 67-17]|uniref:glycosyltransferase n=1 Tax=Microbacterium sp. 67-17 TaxID=1895782 RepID=UPI000B13867E|nr:glycosyltransferase [Microbacterium sp. 67-17]
MTPEVPAGAVIHRLPFAGVGEPELYATVRGAVDRSRSRLSLAAGGSLSWQTYFGSLPTAVWQRHTAVRRVALRATVVGAATATVRGLTAAGTVRELARGAVADGGLDVAVDVGDVGTVWAEVCTETGAVVSDARWESETVPAAPARAVVCVTTFDREADCIRLLRDLADPEISDRVARVVVVDQGSRDLKAGAGFEAASAALGDRLEVIRQANLGGSGGFSRGIVAADDAGGEWALLVDDDVRIEPEGIRRLLAFAERTPVPAVVGAQMLSLVAPRILHTWGERVDRDAFWWEPVAPSLDDVDVVATIADPATARAYDVDFNGWWMCLVPLAAVRRVGAAMPLFIKWDDVEFGLRAQAAGHPVVTLPGAALWHMPWTAKDDGLDWQAYFQLRNRLVAALMHSPRRRGGRVLRDTWTQDVNHVLCLQYGAAAVRRAALADVLRGPSHLLPSLRNRAGEVRSFLAEGGHTVRAEAELPATVPAAPAAPSGRRSVGARLLRVLAHQLRRSRPPAPIPRLPRASGKWWSLGLMDAAVVDSATGRGAFLLTRSRRRCAALLRDATVLRIRLWLRWPQLAAQYRAEAQLASLGSWRAVFADPSTMPRSR